jgi:hypothetical protein
VPSTSWIRLARSAPLSVFMPILPKVIENVSMSNDSTISLSSWHIGFQ